MLHHMREFMGHEATTIFARRVDALGESNMAANRECAGTDAPRGFDGSGTVVQTHMAQVHPEAGLEESSAAAVEWPARLGQGSVNDGRRPLPVRNGRGGRGPVHLLLAGGAGAADPHRRRSDGEGGVGHAHHVVGDAVRLILKRIIDLSDNELCLYCAWEWRCRERV